MVRITEELVRKKSEHNECIINSLEELSLHQENIEKIEHLHNWCRNLEILLLQSNLISKIENLYKLKKLKYLNLAINNIERIENLEKCESLEKLDLTLNFIGDLESVTSLKNNFALKQLYLTGNPCTDYEDYRDYVICQLPQLENLDNNEITRSEKLKALQIKQSLAISVKYCQNKYFKFRKHQKERLASSSDQNLDNESYWKSKSEHAPETRIEMAKRRNPEDKNECKDASVKKQTRLYNKDGRPLNINQAKLQFKFEDEPREFRLQLAVYRYLDTNLISVDLEPDFARITIKGKIFQYVLPEEICVDKSKVQRSQTTGYLLIIMPKVNYKVPISFDRPKSSERVNNGQVKKNFIGDQNIEIRKDIDPDMPPLEYYR
ncbi:hypothetical protein RN001_009527 [Aquatica leii]|uniref:Dynein axonemal assembly factor 11-like CS domain-containing protein n=1 Tax=Aquatica leii TaxID=1421715 RepID=A0AAN7S871_9COLE|nr:hypothetical protein RN001_009527 [Aquatica leii]